MAVRDARSGAWALALFAATAWISGDPECFDIEHTSIVK
jgi:hypothetical protein